MSDATANYPLGQKITDAYGATQLGTETWFPDLDYSSASHPKGVRLSPREVQAVLVKNSSGGALTAGRFVTWSASAVGTEIGATAGVNSQPCGQVDPYLSTTVANGETFWLITSGPTTVTASAAITAGADIQVAATGKVSANVTGSIGKAIGSAAVDGDTLRALIDCSDAGSLGASASGYLSATQQTLVAGGGAVNVTSYYTAGASDAGGDAWTLADGAYVGQLKKIKLITDGGGDAVLTPTNLGGGTTITFADVGDYALLLWDGTDWQPIELGNDADGSTSPTLA